MQKHFNYLILLITGCTMMLLSACSMPIVTKGEEFPRMYEEKPISILVLPPMNQSTAANAKEYYSTTIQEPLSFSGYYVLPYEVTAEMLKMEGIYDSELLKDMPLSKFKEFFGADAVLFTTIKEWDKSYMVFASSLTVSIDCQMKSTETNEILWEYNGTVVVDLSGGGSDGSPVGLIVSAVATAVNTAIVDYVPYARMANYQALQSIPYGKYHAQFNLDQDQQIMDQTPEGGFPFPMPY